MKCNREDCFSYKTIFVTYKRLGGFIDGAIKCRPAKKRRFISLGITECHVNRISNLYLWAHHHEGISKLSLNFKSAIEIFITYSCLSAITYLAMYEKAYNNKLSIVSTSVSCADYVRIDELSKGCHCSRGRFIA